MKRFLLFYDVVEDYAARRTMLRDAHLRRPRPSRSGCPYAFRPPLAQERLHVTSDGEIWLTLRKRWTDGTTHLRFETIEDQSHGAFGLDAAC